MKTKAILIILLLSLFATRPARGQASDIDYWDKQNSLLDPGLLLPLKRGNFSYPIPADETVYLLSSWGTRLGDSGRMELRQPTKPLPLRGVTLSGFSDYSSAILLKPMDYAGEEGMDLYYERLNSIHEMQTRYIPFDEINEYRPFLTGAYGAIMLRMYCHDYAWIAGIHNGIWYNLSNELGDYAPDHQRTDIDLTLPLDKRTVSQAATAWYARPVRPDESPDQRYGGSIEFVLLPADWSRVPDNNVYLFRDDFMAQALSSEWKTTGDVSINSTYQWVQMRGNGSWGGAGMYGDSFFDRSDSPSMIVDVFPTNESPYYPGTAYTVVGWNDGTGVSYTDFEHAIIFGAPGKIYIYENGVSLGVAGSGFTSGGIYRVKIKLLPGGGASYYIQGAPQYPAIGSDSWASISPVGSSGSSASLHLGAGQFSSQDAYLSDFRVVDD